MKARLRSERGSGSEAEGGRKGEGRKREERRERGARYPLRSFDKEAQCSI